MAGFSRYLRFIARRERIVSTLWIVLTVILTAAIAAMYPSLLGDDTTRTAMVEMLKSPAMVGMMGPVYGADAYTPAIAFAQMMAVWVMIAMAAMNIFFVIRHTRADEEQGRLEVLRALPVGRLATATGTIVAAFCLNLIIAALTAVSVMMVGNGSDFSGNAAGAWAYALEIGAFGMVMAAIALLTAQLFTTSRGASSAAFAVLGVFYVMRAAGDYADSAVSYISPMGLALRTFAFYDNNIYPVVILIVLGLVISIIALAVCARRDLGEGIIPARKGRVHAKASLLSPFGLAWRLTGTNAIVWCVVVFSIAAMYGSMLGDIDSFIESNDFYKQIMGVDNGVADSMTDNFVAMMFIIMSLFSAIPVITISGRLHAEEKRGRLEPLFARSVSRTNMFLSYIVIATIESVVTLLCSAVGMYVSGEAVGVTLELETLVKAALCYLPAVLIMMSITVAMTGLAPKWGVISWAVFAYSMGAVYLGRMLNLPDWVVKISPFGNVPQMPIDAFRAEPLVALSIIAVGFTAAGVWGFRRRDVS